MTSKENLQQLLFASKQKCTVSQQRTKRVVRPRQYAPTGGPSGSYQGDLIFFEELSGANRGYKSILTVISANTRFVYAEPLKRKSETVMAMRRIIKAAKEREPMTKFWTDSGTEFTSAAFANLMKRMKIEHHISDPKNHSPLGRIDRFHVTLRTILERWRLRNGNNNWVDRFQDIIAAYNARENLATGAAPSEISTEEIEANQDRERVRAMEVATRVDKGPLVPGVKVRHITNRTSFTKGSAPRWSVGIHPIESRIGVDAFKVKDIAGTFKDYELQAVVEPTDAEAGAAAEEGRVELKKEQQLMRRLAREGVEARAPSPRRLRSAAKAPVEKSAAEKGRGRGTAKQQPPSTRRLRSASKKS